MIDVLTVIFAGIGIIAGLFSMVAFFVYVFDTVPMRILFLENRVEKLEKSERRK